MVADREYSKQRILSVLDPLVAKWFSNKFRELTPPQRHAIVNIHEGKNTLIASPTGSGKTLSAFLSIISELVKLAKSGHYAEIRDELIRIMEEIKENEHKQQIKSVIDYIRTAPN